MGAKTDWNAEMIAVDSANPDLVESLVNRMEEGSAMLLERAKGAYKGGEAPAEVEKDETDPNAPPVRRRK